MKNLYRFLISSPLMGALFIFLAIVMGVATFIENDYGVNASRTLVYNSWWFEAAFALLGFNMFGNMLKFKMFQWSKLPSFLFHSSFFIILLGAAITRYVGYEGTMHIRENESSAQIKSLQTFVKVKSTVNGVVETKTEAVSFSIVTPYECNLKLDNGLTIESSVFVPNAEMEPVENVNGSPYLMLAVSNSMGRQDKAMVPGEYLNVDGTIIGFGSNDTSSGDFLIFDKEGTLYFTSKLPAFQMQMQSGKVDTLIANQQHPFYAGMLYSAGNVRLVQKSYLPKAILAPSHQLVKKGLPDAVVFNVEYNNQVREVCVLGHASEIGQEQIFHIGNNKIEISYGALPMELPFSLYLKDFIIERYPGSNSPSSFESEIVLIDEGKGVKEDRRIFMNNILNYRGYRFFQSSYDTDEKGTVLSVNHDPWGTVVTYIGYALLTLGMLLALFMNGTRFRTLYNTAVSLSKARKALVILLFITVGSMSGFAQRINITQSQAEKFGKIWVQDNQGRIEPLNTLNNEITRKLVKHNSFKDLSSDQFVLDILINTLYWQNEPLITVANPQLRDLVGVTEKKASFKSFFLSDGSYKLGQVSEESYRKKPSERNKFDQEVIKVDEQVNVFYMLQAGKLFKVFPNPSDLNGSWLSPVDLPSKGFATNDSLFVRNVFSLYIGALSNGDQNNASQYIDGILNYQVKYAKTVLPSDFHQKMEIFYNEANVFVLLMPFLMILGFVLLFVQFLTLLFATNKFDWVERIGFWLMIVAFVVYVCGLALRWYISNHAPWSNGYESMLYIGFCTFLAGLLFSSKNKIATSVSALFTSVILLVAHLSWMNPEITNLVPVLKSYWLVIHVAVIVASYGFLGLGAIIAFTNLLLMGMKDKKNNVRINLMIEELTVIAEMAMTIGLYLLTIGAFLGGIWANESWGRYWGWDPKETWSAVTIFVYAFILHMRMIPGLKSLFAFNIIALIGYGSVIMTYLGVNYYLAGLHSYAKGDPLPVPTFVYYTIVVIAVVGFYAWYNNRKSLKFDN